MLSKNEQHTRGFATKEGAEAYAKLLAEPTYLMVVKPDTDGEMMSWFTAEPIAYVVLPGEAPNA